jgi:superfamily II DNA or RNA helicase
MKVKITPRPYQTLAINAGLKGLRSKGKKKALVVMATGLGKMLTSAMTAKKFCPKDKILFLVHDNSIIDHAIEEWKLVFGENMSYAVYNGFSKNGATSAQIVFTTWQTMGNNLKTWKKNHFDLVVVDEAHHTEAETYAPTVRYFFAPKIGFTATPDREDGTDIRNVFGKEVINISLEEAIARGWLPRIEYHVVMDESLDNNALQKIVQEIRDGHKRFTMAEVNRRLFIKKRDNEIARIIGGYTEKSIVFCASIPHAECMAKALPLATAFHSKKSRDTRRQILTNLKNGTLRQVTAVDAFNEGVDVPSIGLAAFGRVTGSRRIFLQQLGRGLRLSPGKDKLIVLDFVGNLERIIMVREMMNRIADFHEKFARKGELDREGYSRKPFEVSGAGFEFTFSDQIVDLMTVLSHCQSEFYETWEEASEAAKKLKPGSKYAYYDCYRKDPRLPRNPDIHYSNFPGWRIFLNADAVEYYKTCAEASVAAIRLGIRTKESYPDRRRNDPRLPGWPPTHYSNFPGWKSFLRGCADGHYETCKKASEATIALRIDSILVYKRRYKEDPRLPSNPQAYYPGFLGWNKFFGTKPFYKTCAEASRATIRLMIKSETEYGKKYKEDPRLTATPYKKYSDWPGWPKFLGKVK